ncbi:hypothetical protein IV102_14065 [bacterium]|nr:hypothetical protein [bacterium]
MGIESIEIRVNLSYGGGLCRRHVGETAEPGKDIFKLIVPSAPLVCKDTKALMNYELDSKLPGLLLCMGKDERLTTLGLSSSRAHAGTPPSFQVLALDRRRLAD